MLDLAPVAGKKLVQKKISPIKINDLFISKSFSLDDFNLKKCILGGNTHLWV
jgi:hypothetical protein